MHVTAPVWRDGRPPGGFSLLEAVIAAGLLLLTVTAVSLCVGSAVRAGARLERTREADAALQLSAERLRSLPFCAPSLPARPDGPAAFDLCAAVFPHAASWKNTAGARYVAVGGEPALSPGRFVTVFGEGGVEVSSTAWFLRGAYGPRLAPAELVGWDVETSEEPPGPALEVVLVVHAPGGVRSVRLVLGALAPGLTPLSGGRCGMTATLEHALGRRDAGFSLMELLVAAAVVGVVLAAAFGWLWSVAAVAVRTDDRAQAATIAAACVRGMALEVRQAVGVAPPPPGRDPGRALALLHDHPAGAPEVVLVVWDPSRRVVWRNASGAYLADHIAAWRVACLLADGRTVPGEAMGAADWTAVRGVRVDLTVVVGTAPAKRSALISLGPA